MLNITKRLQSKYFKDRGETPGRHQIDYNDSLLSIQNLLGVNQLRQEKGILGSLKEVSSSLMHNKLAKMGESISDSKVPLFRRVGQNMVDIHSLDNREQEHEKESPFIPKELLPETPSYTSYNDSDPKARYEKEIIRQGTEEGNEKLVERLEHVTNNTSTDSKAEIEKETDRKEDTRFNQLSSNIVTSQDDTRDDVVEKIDELNKDLTKELRNLSRDLSRNSGLGRDGGMDFGDSSSDKKKKGKSSKVKSGKKGFLGRTIDSVKNVGSKVTKSGIGSKVIGSGKAIGKVGIVGAAIGGIAAIPSIFKKKEPETPEVKRKEATVKSQNVKETVAKEIVTKETIKDSVKATQSNTIVKDAEKPMPVRQTVPDSLKVNNKPSKTEKTIVKETVVEKPKGFIAKAKAALSKVPGAKAVGKAAKVVGRVAGPVGALVTVGLAAKDTLTGWQKAEETFNLKAGQEATTGQKIASSAGALVSGLTFGLISASSIAKKSYSLFDSKKTKTDFIANELRKKEALISMHTRSRKTLVRAIQQASSPKLQDQLKKELKEDDDRIAKLRNEVKELKRKSFNVPMVAGLGAVSQKYESGGRGAGTVSSGKGDHGGASYGMYQLASNTGTLNQFINSSTFKESFEGLKPGSKEFNKAWKDIAEKNKTVFEKEQHAFIQRTHYEPLVKKLKDSGMDLSGRSKAVQEALFSVAVQHGSNTKLVDRALGKENISKMSDLEIIERIFDERAKRTKTGELAYFKKSSKKVQESVARRFQREEQDLLAMASAKPVSQTPAVKPTVTVSTQEMVASATPVSRAKAMPVHKKQTPIDKKTKDAVKAESIANKTTIKTGNQIVIPEPKTQVVTVQQPAPLPSVNKENVANDASIEVMRKVMV